MDVIRCKDCGFTLKATNGACPICGSNNRDITVEDRGYGKEKAEAKVFVVEFKERIGLEASVDADISQALAEEERGFWKKLINFLKDNIVMERLEIGFPSGIKVILRPKKESERK
jgi:hypothetical protein